jgi:hypothetical protein
MSTSGPASSVSVWVAAAEPPAPGAGKVGVAHAEDDVVVELGRCSGDRPVREVVPEQVAGADVHLASSDPGPSSSPSPAADPCRRGPPPAQTSHFSLICSLLRSRSSNALVRETPGALGAKGRGGHFAATRDHEEDDAAKEIWGPFARDLRCRALSHRRRVVLRVGCAWGMPCAPGGNRSQQRRCHARKRLTRAARPRIAKVSS